MNYNTIVWIDNTLESDEYVKYWNDAGTEIAYEAAEIGNYQALEDRIHDEGFIEDLGNCLKFLSKFNKKLSGQGVEIASGTMWLTAYLMNKMSDNISHFYSLDYSNKYIYETGPKLLNYYNVKKEKLSLCLGSFYDIKLPDRSLDFVIMSQAFHHADDPEKLLKELYRVLNDKGFVIMLGEIYISKKLYVKCFLNYILSKCISYKFFPNFLFKIFPVIKNYKKNDLDKEFQSLYFPVDPVWGDHYHLKSQYKSFFIKNNFNFYEIHSKKKQHLTYILLKNDH